MYCFANCCRFCLTINSDLYDCNIISDVNGITYLQQITEFQPNLKHFTSETFPELICIDCITVLNTINKFRETCFKSYELLANYCKQLTFVDNDHNDDRRAINVQVSNSFKQINIKQEFFSDEELTQQQQQQQQQQYNSTTATMDEEMKLEGNDQIVDNFHSNEMPTDSIEKLLIINNSNASSTRSQFIVKTETSMDTTVQIDAAEHFLFDMNSPVTLSALRGELNYQQQDSEHVFQQDDANVNEHESVTGLKATVSKRKKNCFVPHCNNDNILHPNKLFIMVPMILERRKKWFAAVGRPLVKTTSTFCCADHFDMEKDSENWINHKLMGTKLRLKYTTVPHINVKPITGPTHVKTCTNNNNNNKNSINSSSNKIINSPSGPIVVEIINSVPNCTTSTTTTTTTTTTAAAATVAVSKNLKQTS